MPDNVKNVVVTSIFILILVIFFLINLLKKDVEISIAERRKLAEFPSLTIKNVLDGSFKDKFEKYTTDQMLKRDEFRKLKSELEFYLFRKKDNNSIYMYQDKLIKIEYPLNEESLLNATRKINKIQKSYFNYNKCYYSIVPDKNYFTNKSEYISMDYEKLQKIMRDNIENAEYINIFDCLSLDDYYVTDIHWKQENLQKVVNKMSSEMGFYNRLTTPYEKKEIVEFDGLYKGEFPVKLDKDKIYILTNNIIEKSSVYSYETKKETQIYDESKLESFDKYDIYLSGNTPLLTITNPYAKMDKELIVFRDSFASSLIPLFIEGYNKITLVDIRYMRAEDLEKYIEIKNQDVLFLYSTLVLNNSSILR